MNWWKDILQKITGSEMKKETLHEKDSNTYEGKYREIETKITYEYPKGKFRFPLIEDKKQDRRLRPERAVNLEKTTKKQHAPRQNEQSIEKKIKIESERKPVANQAKTPFRNTEVASPIFGFQKKPAEKANPLEFELSDGDIIKKADHIIADFYRTQKNNQFNNKAETNSHISNTSQPLSSRQDDDAKVFSSIAEPASAIVADDENDISSSPVMQDEYFKDELDAVLTDIEKGPEIQDQDMAVLSSLESAPSAPVSFTAEQVSLLATAHEDNISSAPVLEEEQESDAVLTDIEKGPEIQDQDMAVLSSLESAPSAPVSFTAEQVSLLATAHEDNISSAPVMEEKQESDAVLTDIEKGLEMQDQDMAIPSSLESAPSAPVSFTAEQGSSLATAHEDNISSAPVMEEELDESDAVLTDIEKGPEMQDQDMAISSSLESALSAPVSSTAEPASLLATDHKDSMTPSFSETTGIQETCFQSDADHDEDASDHVVNQDIEAAAAIDSALSKDNERDASRNDASASTLLDGQIKKEESKRKQSIPFNVVMLKSDKRVLEEKNNQLKKAAVLELHKPNQQSAQQLKPNVHVSDQTAERDDNTKATTEPTQSTRVLPFNVMMLKSDKKAYKRNLEQQQSIQDKLEKKALPEVEKEEQHQHIVPDRPYTFPNLELLDPPVASDVDDHWVSEQTELLNETLANFKVRAKVVHVSQGPSVTRFEIQPEKGVKVNKITNLSDDLKLNLAARDIRIEAPIPGKSTIGIEIPNKESRPVFLREIIASSAFKQDESPLTAALGLDISGHPIVTDLQKMPHGLIAGATGSGKSVCINSILVSLLYKATPDELKLLLIDPKMVELAPYHHIPHLVSPVITDVKAATAALKWAVGEMERRYELFAHTSVRNIQRFNELAEKAERPCEKLPYIVIVIDELADLMMMSPADVEEAICRIAQKARACGIHLIIATQRPSVDVITGLIKANVPTRIAFSVSSQVDSRTIIDISGAEKLLGRGDMLFLANGSSKAVRLQGTFVTDEEIDCVIAHVREQREPQYLFQQEELLKRAQLQEEEDDLFFDACDFVIDQGSASTSLLQRHFRVGYNRAARLITLLEEHGVVSEARGSKPRDVLVSQEDIEAIKQSSRIV
ncbi:DNA translocase FtsK [Bacillus chungangensis]|uniref:S-DNA-T family DNA segregation ATPase FtsK/SpoIIIE n=1 Tax=Bacillus chungangensis TaxID=587633 RepID=A0ABT9WU98_9BACI|nr:DNA translocase FtsK [Bacillus chungangensis]MDQ0176863.1 S-DNA-T family DNA segregation ATPase FtsK/SpoIIIE [Bacillus chungangensis]